MSPIELCVFGCDIRVECFDEQAASFLTRIYRLFKHPIKKAEISYRIARESSSERLYIARNGASPEIARDCGDFIYKFDKDLTIETQKLRPDLYFVHAAVLALDGYAIALVAPSGYGKSTTTWGLLHHGLQYLSDELAPIDITKMRIHPFPHALCLKAEPPSGYPLPTGTIYTARTAHVPTACLPCETVRELMPLKAIFFLRFIGEADAPVLKSMRNAEATARLFMNALNPIAHSADGLDAAMEIVSRTRCFELLSSNLQATCELIKSTFLSAFSIPTRI